MARQRDMYTPQTTDALATEHSPPVTGAALGLGVIDDQRQQLGMDAQALQREQALQQSDEGWPTPTATATVGSVEGSVEKGFDVGQLGKTGVVETTTARIIDGITPTGGGTS